MQLGEQKAEKLIFGLFVQFGTSLDRGCNGTTLGFPEVDLLGPRTWPLTMAPPSGVTLVIAHLSVPAMKSDSSTCR